MPDLAPQSSADQQPSAPRPPRAVGIGELVWDLLPTGPRLGGAPFNVIANLVKLGWSGGYLTAVGDDDLGREARGRIAELGVDASLLQTADAPTGTVRVELDADGVPTFEIVSPAAYERVRPVGVVALRPLDAIVFGTLAQRFEGTFETTVRLAAGAASSIRLYDVNLRDGCWDGELIKRLLPLATIVKLNEEEAVTIAGELGLGWTSIEAFSRAIADRFGLRAVAVTRGADGAGLLLDGEFRELPAPPVQVVDTVGAGDAFSSGLVAGVHNGWALDRVLEHALHIASLVASREGATPAWNAPDPGS